MKLPKVHFKPEHIEQFKAKIKELKGIELTEEEALEQATRLMNAVNLVLIHSDPLEKPVTKDNTRSQ